MPVRVARRGDKYRVVEPDGTIARAKTKSGQPGKARDSGGTTDRDHAQAIANAVNRGLSKGRK